MQIDLLSFLAAAFKGVPLIFVVIGLTEWAKSLGVQGAQIRVTSMIIGVVFGGAYMIATERPPEGDWWVVFGYAFGVLLYGASMGIVASGLYDATVGKIKELLAQGYPPK